MHKEKKIYFRSSSQEVLCKTIPLKILQNSQNAEATGSLNNVVVLGHQLYQKESPAQLFCFEFRKVFKNIFLAEQLRMNSFRLYCWILRSFSEHLLYRTPLEVFLFDVQVSGFQSAYTITISQVLFKHFVWDRKIASRRCSFNQSHWKLSMKRLIRSEVARCQSPSFWKKTLLCILPSFSQNIYYQYYHYFFRKGFEIVRAIFSSGNINKK